MSTLHLNKLAQVAIDYLTNIINLSISNGQILKIWHKATIIPILKLGKNSNIGKNWRQISLLCLPAKTLEELLLPKLQTCIPFHHAQHGLALDMHCTVDDHRRHCCRLLKKKAGSPNSDRWARSDSCIRLCGPSSTARLCIAHQLTGIDPSLALQLDAEQTSQGSFSAKTI